MGTANNLTLIALVLFMHLAVVLVFSKFIVAQEPSNRSRFVYFVLVVAVPFLGACLVYRLLQLNWFRNEDGSKRAGAISIDFLELDAIFNPGSKQVLEERRREKKEVKQEGENLNKD